MGVWKEEKMTQIIMLLIITAGSGFGCAVGKRKFEEMLPISCSAIVLILFLFGLLGNLKAGVYAVLGSAGLLWIFSMGYVLKRKKWKETICNFFTPAFVVFTLLYLLLGVLMRDQVASQWDEFSHWADIVKAMTFVDDFGTNPNAGSLFASYPPGMALFQYLFQKIYLIVKPQEKFSEWRMFFAYQIFFLSFLMPFLKNLSFRKFSKIVISALMIWWGSMIIFTNVYSCIYIDAILGFLFGTGMASIFLKKKTDMVYHINICMTISMLVLMKDAGMLFGAVLFVAYCIAEVNGQKCEQKRLSLGKKEFVKLLTAVAALILPKILWNINIKMQGAATAFSKSVDVMDLVRVILGMEPESYRTTVLKLFHIAFLSHKLEIGDLNLQIPYAALLVVFTVLGYWFYVQETKFETKGKSTQKAVIYLMCAVSIIFIEGTCVSYMYKFSESEAVGLAAFSRYMKIIFQCWWIFLLMLLVNDASTESKVRIRKELLIFCMIALILPWGKISFHVTRQEVEISRGTRAPYQTLIDSLETKTENEEIQRVLIIDQEDPSFTELLFSYALRPNKVSVKGLSDDASENDIKELKERILDTSGYIALYKVDDFFVEHFSEVFECAEDIQENGVYYIDQQSGLLELSK